MVVQQPGELRERVWHCRHCGRPVIACRSASGRLVAVDPEPVCGGELVINASQSLIISIRNPREVAKARRCGEPGFVPHDRVCRCRTG